MQYEPTLSRAELIELATKSYFGNVDKKDMDATLACFNDEALFCVQGRDPPHVRRFLRGLEINRS
jgi:hypothetical protein